MAFETGRKEPPWTWRSRQPSLRGCAKRRIRLPWSQEQRSRDVMHFS